MNRALEHENDDEPIDARDQYRRALELLKTGDRGGLYSAIKSRISKIQVNLETVTLPETVKKAKELLKDKDYKKAEKEILLALRIKENAELRNLLNFIRTSRVSERVAVLFKKADEKYQDKEFDEAIKIIKIVVKEFSNNEQIVIQANKKLDEYKTGKKAWAFRQRGLKNFEEDRWNQALTNFIEYLNLWKKKDPDIEEKIKICRKNLMSIANRTLFNRLYAQAVFLYNTKKYINSRAIFYRLKNRFPYKRDEVLEYIEKIQKLLEKQNRIADILAKAQTQYRLGNNKYKKSAFNNDMDSEKRISMLKASKFNFYSARHLFKQIKRQNEINQCNTMIERIDNKIKSIKAEENDRNKALVKKYIRDGKIYFDQQNFRKTIETMNKVLAIIPDHPEAQHFLKAAREAMLVREEAELTPKHRHYVYYITFKKRGLFFYNKAEKMSNKGRNLTSQAKTTYRKSLEQWRTILLWFPNNEEAHLYIRRIYRRIEPQAYEQFLQKYISLIKLYLKPPRPKKERAYHLLKMILKEDRAFFNRHGLAALMKQARPQRLVTTLNQADSVKVRSLLQQANSAFAQRNDNKTIALTGQAIRVNPFSKDPLMNTVRRLMSQAINRKRFGTAGVASASGPPPAAFQQATRFYYQATAAYQTKNYAKTISLCNQALRVMPSHSQARQLRSIAQARLR